VLALLFLIFLPSVHRFYVGKWVTGILFFLTGGGAGLWWLYDLIMIATGRFRDAEGRVLGPPQITYDQLPAPNRAKPKQLKSEPVEPELAPLDQPDFEMDDEVMRDPLEDKFDELERELGTGNV
jgi:hypothetical protein